MTAVGSYWRKRAHVLTTLFLNHPIIVLTFIHILYAFIHSAFPSFQCLYLKSLTKSKYVVVLWIKNKMQAGQQWPMPLILALRGRGWQISEFEAIVVCRVSSRTSRVTKKNPVLEKNKNKVPWCNWSFGHPTTILRGLLQMCSRSWKGRVFLPTYLPSSSKSQVTLVHH